jgi:anaerobic selenocysteine-containing dehydrogenase
MIELGKALTNEELNPGIDAFIVFNSNPVVTTPNQNLVIKGLKRPDLMTVVLEHFITDTARYADYIFPATTVLENWDLLDSWGTEYLNINEPAIEPLGEARTNTAFFRALATEMGLKEPYLFESDLEIIEKTLDSKHEYLQGITFESLRKTGWARLNVPAKWMPHAEGNFKTPSGKCQLYNPAMDPPLPEYHAVSYSAEEMASYPLHLLTIKSTRYFLNSSHANIDYLLQNEGMPLVDISQEDAAIRGISDGDPVKVFNPRGEVYMNARIKQKVRKGVVCMPQGFWPSLMKGGSSANALTDDLLADLGGGGAFQENRVEIVKV